ncbi:hypothetical protein DPEC_G00342400 [Dallia pectoralis]|uniref:Uncharacterized protein n=1 Tax=Dallia pectoralis TaxID=75939 RepID=A0ACC2F5V4_DALPE|nr:hypothetical protein DPEC_G00342400 [Dallia pectoralis]
MDFHSLSSGSTNLVSVEDSVDVYNHSLHRLLDLHAPITSGSVSLTWSAPWYTCELRKMKAAVRVLERRLKGSGLTVHKQAYREHQSAYAEALRVVRSKHYSSIINNSPAHTPFFSVASDASNHGTTKLFPLSVHCWTPDLGVQTKVLDFCDDSDETSAAIHNQIVTKLEENGLGLDMISVFSADNDSLNYGRYNSVFQKLKENNNCILKANCVAHIVHNSAKHAGDQLNIDIENVVNKTFSHFSTSAKRIEELKSIHTFVEVYLSFLSNALKIFHVLPHPQAIVQSGAPVVEKWATLLKHTHTKHDSISFFPLECTNHQCFSGEGLFTDDKKLDGHKEQMFVKEKVLLNAVRSNKKYKFKKMKMMFD